MIFSMILLAITVCGFVVGVIEDAREEMRDGEMFIMYAEDRVDHI